MISQALDYLKQGKTHAFRAVADSVLVVTQNSIVKRTFHDHYGTQQDVLAIKVNGKIVGNSSALNTRSGRGMVTSEQLELSQLIPMIPFSVIKQAGLNIGTFSEIACGPEETIFRAVETRVTESELDKLKTDSAIKDLHFEVSETRNWNDSKNVKFYFNVEYTRGQHFAGSRLFEVDKRRFLLDVDRIELLHGLINPFLVELKDSNVSTIEGAYQSLMPTRVRMLVDSGTDVKRQGEWFFIPVSELESKQCDKTLENTPERERRGILRAGQNRPNSVESMVTVNNRYFVKGTVSHTGREHRDLVLTVWYEALPNTSVTSWTITGDLD